MLIPITDNPDITKLSPTLTLPRNILPLAKKYHEVKRSSKRIHGIQVKYYYITTTETKAKELLKEHKAIMKEEEEAAILRETRDRLRETLASEKYSGDELIAKVVSIIEGKFQYTLLENIAVLIPTNLIDINMGISRFKRYKDVMIIAPYTLVIKHNPLVTSKIIKELVSVS